MSAPNIPGWYMVHQKETAAIACLYTNGKGWWTIGDRRQRLPQDFTVGESIDSLLNRIEGFRVDRRELDPRHFPHSEKTA